MAELFVLFDGYSRMVDGDDQRMLANCSCTLIKDGDVRVIVDTMTAWDAERIQESLEVHGVRPEDVQYVVNTHGHSDHCGSNHLFQNAKHILGNSIAHKDMYEFIDLTENNYQLSTNVSLMATPGHTPDSISVCVHNTSYSTVVVAGDLFEKEEDIEDPSHWVSAGSFDEPVQRQKRYEVCAKADYIVPGHGPMFRVQESYRKSLAEQSKVV